ncbi:MAG: hypothetical protein ABIJ48_03700 [Actinomycetota bacterium]
MSDLNKRDVEALLGGRTPEGLEPLAALVERLRREASLSVDPATAKQHVAVAAAASREAPVPATVPGSTVRPLWRRRTVFAGLLSTIFGKVFAGAVALAAATAGAGTAGVLPDPVQEFFDGSHEIERLVEQVRLQEQDQLHLQDQTQLQDQTRDRDQLGEQTGTTNTTQQQQQQQQGQDDAPNTTQQQQQQQQGQDNGTANQGSTTTAAGYGYGYGYGPGEPGNTTSTTMQHQYGPGEPGGNTTTTQASYGPGEPGSGKP